MAQVSVDNLSTWLANQAENTVDTPYVIELTGVTLNNFSTIKTSLQANPDKYVDFSDTTFSTYPTILSESFANCPTLVACPNFSTVSGVPIYMSGTYKNCINLKEAKIVRGTKEMYQTFKGCTSLVTVPTTISGVTNYTETFRDCSSLITAPRIIGNSSLTSLDSTFRGCSSLKDAPSITDYVTTLSWTFMDCTSLTETPPISDSVTSMVGAFNGCTSLVDIINIPINVTNIEETFLGCTSLVEPPELPNTVTRMYYTFSNCTSLESTPNFPNSITTLEGAFKGCSSLVSIETLPELTSFEKTFQDCVSLATPPILPTTAKYLSETFSGCILLENAPELPSGVISLLRTFENCRTIEEPPEIPSSVTNMINTFAGCSALLELPEIPNGITNLSGTFKGCSKITEPPTLPANVENLNNTFEDCTALLTAPTIPNSVEYMNYTFKNCTNLSQVPVLSSVVEELEGTFYGCEKITTINISSYGYATSLQKTFYGTGIVTAPAIPNNITNLKETFKNCANLKNVPVVPSTVTNMVSTFEGCILLESIESFKVPLNTLKNNTNFQNTFANCPSLRNIGYYFDEDAQWHVFSLKIGEDSIEGAVYDKDKNKTIIEEETINKTNLRLYQKTDELWFPTNNYTDQEIETLINNMIDNRYAMYNKTNIISPTDKSFVLWKDSQSRFVSNIDFGGSGSSITVYDTEEEMEQDLPNKQDGDLVGTLSADEGELQDAPLGSVMSYLGTTDPSDGKWLITDGRDTTGTAIELETHYPSLFMFLGGTNVLPEIFDHSRLSAWETKTISTNSATPTIMDYDGILFIQVYRSGSQVGSNVKLFINGEEYRSSLDTSATNYWTEYITAPVRKGDSVYYTFAGTVDKCGGWFYKSHKIIKAVSSVDMYHVPASEIAQIEQYFDNGLAQLNTWVDVSSDFSVVDSVAWANTPTSSLKVLYNAFQKKLKVWSWYNSTKSASATHAFTLQYDGNNTDIVFDPTTTIAMQTLNKSYLGYDTTTNPDSAPNSNGFECSYNIRTSKQIRLGGFNRNASTAWGANICLVAEISL